MIPSSLGTLVSAGAGVALCLAALWQVARKGGEFEST